MWEDTGYWIESYVLNVCHVYSTVQQFNVCHTALRDPDYDGLVAGSRVLVQHSSDLWTNATVQDILEDRSAFCIKYDKNKEIAEVTAVQLFPLCCEDDSAEQNSDDDCDDTEVILDFYCFLKLYYIQAFCIYLLKC